MVRIHEQHGHGRGPKDFLCMAAHQQASQTVPSMRPKNNQVRAPCLELVCDVFDQAVGRALA